MSAFSSWFQSRNVYHSPPASTASMVVAIDPLRVARLPAREREKMMRKTRSALTLAALVAAFLFGGTIGSGSRRFAIGSIKQRGAGARAHADEPRWGGGGELGERARVRARMSG